MNRYIIIISILVQLNLYNLQINQFNQPPPKEGTIPEIDALIKDPFVLKAISFSVSYTDLVYKDILEEVIEYIEKVAVDLKNDQKEDAEYYIYILKNVRKYTIQWLTEEFHQYFIQSEEELKKDEKTYRKKRISEFIYYTALEYGGDLVLEGKDTSLNGWKRKKDNLKLEL